MQVRGIFGEGEIIAPPRVDATALLAMGFVACPVPFQHLFQPGGPAHELYRLAYEQARAALDLGWYERLYRAPRN
jgi:hypothetical protein